MIGPYLATAITVVLLFLILFILPFLILTYGRHMARWSGLRVHVFEKTHRSGFTKRCIHCGEEQQAYMLWVKGPEINWWETASEGDGSCNEKPLPRRWEWF